jgi:peptidylprolyl isomerase
MNKVDYGAFVKLCYTGTLKNGVVFDRTDKCKPLAIQLGDGNLVGGFEKALIGMSRNERKSFLLASREAYGDRDEKLERIFDRASLQLGFEPFPGQVILFETQDGQEYPAVVKFVNDKTIVADFNHPLAGRDLAYEVEVASIDETQSDSQSKCVAECCCA